MTMIERNFSKPAEICAPQQKDDKMKLEHTALPAQSKAHFKGNGRNTDPRVADESSRTVLPRAGKDGVVMPDDSFDDSPQAGPTLRLTGEASAKRCLEVDVDKYQKYLDDPALSDDQKEEIIRALWSIMMAFADLGFGIHPIQEACGQVNETLDEQAKGDSNGDQATHTKMHDAFNSASRDGNSRPAQEE